jgi:cytochrome c-type biogenesis protein
MTTESGVDQVGSISLFAAFIAGIISFISPCVLPLIPMYISFISGLSLEEMKNGIGSKRILRRVIISSLLFIFGFSIVFILMGASFTFLGGFLLAKLSMLRKISGFIIIVFGLHIIGVFRLRFLNYERRFHFRHRPARFIGPFLVGLAFAFGWTPCIGPVLSAILIYSGSQETVWHGISLLSMYSLGLGVPFFLAGIGTNTFLSFLKRIQKYHRVIEIATGTLLITMGVLLIMDFLTVLTNYLVRWFPWLLRG